MVKPWSRRRYLILAAFMIGTGIALALLFAKVAENDDADRANDAANAARDEQLAADVRSLKDALGTANTRLKRGGQKPVPVPNVAPPPALPGEQGPQGSRGDQGIAGPRGRPGQQGSPGQRGERGQAGVSGSQGAPGGVGETGVAGQQGIPGEAGEAGAAGATGPPGPEGDVGPQGPSGETGAQGPQGVQGPAGERGAAGAAGIGIASIVCESAAPFAFTFTVAFTDGTTQSFTCGGGG